MTRDQLSNYFKLGSIRNTNRILNGLSDHLSSIRYGYQTIYYLSKEGRDYVECEKIRKKSSNVQHYIMRNEFWLFYGCPGDWKNEIKVSNGETTVIADAMFTRNGFHHFLEVDNLQNMKENRSKIERYKKLLESLVLNFNYYPTFIWITTTEYRRKQIQRFCDGLKVKVYTINEIQ